MAGMSAYLEELALRGADARAVRVRPARSSAPDGWGEVASGFRLAPAAAGTTEADAGPGAGPMPVDGSPMEAGVATTPDRGSPHAIVAPPTISAASTGAVQRFMPAMPAPEPPAAGFVAMPVAADRPAARPTPAADAPTVAPVAVRSGPAAEPGGPTPRQTAARILEPTWTGRPASDAIGRIDQGPEGRPGLDRITDARATATVVEESSSEGRPWVPGDTAVEPSISWPAVAEARSGVRTAGPMVPGHEVDAHAVPAPPLVAPSLRTSVLLPADPPPSPVPTDMGSLGTVVHIGSIEIRAGAPPATSVPLPPAPPAPPASPAVAPGAVGFDDYVALRAYRPWER
jgi:hypothetical protein